MPRKKKPRLLTASRPPTVRKPKTISRHATKALINTHHHLEKRKQQAKLKGDSSAEAAINKEIDALGGIVKYQEASLQGQRQDRGGDSSEVLMNWLKPVTAVLKAQPVRMLEVGALSIDNACSKSGCFNMERIDLNSQAEGILQQDFMDRPLPTTDSQRFDIISLSLVLNYIPHHPGRGEMLLRTLDFLREPDQQADGAERLPLPSLFLVLPKPCVANSRYLDEERLEAIMQSLGYEKTESKTTRRLVYYLWRRVSEKPRSISPFFKKEIRPGAKRNNFAIGLQPR